MGKHPGGRPPKFTSAEDMQKLIDEYFKECEGTLLTDHNGDPMVDKWGIPIMLGQKPPTVPGLALALGFNSRQSLLNYKAKAEFVDVITRAKTRLEQYAAERLYDRDGAKGAQFTLAVHYGWRVNTDSDGGENDGGGVVELPAVLPKPETVPEGDNAQ